MRAALFFFKNNLHTMNALTSGLSQLATPKQYSHEGVKYENQLFLGLGLTGTTALPFRRFSLMNGNSNVAVGLDRAIIVYGMQLISTHDRDQTGGPSDIVITTHLVVWPGRTPSTINIDSTSAPGTKNIWLSHVSSGTLNSNKVLGISWDLGQGLFIPSDYRFALFASIEAGGAGTPVVNAYANITYTF